MMSMFKTNPNALEDYLRSLGFLQSIPVRCDLYFKPRFVSFFTQQDSLNCFKRLVSIADQTKSIVIKLKIVICLHHIAMNKNTLHQEIFQEPISGLEINSGENENSVKWLYEVASSYYNYIRKICANSDIYWSAKTSKPLSKNQGVGGLMTKVYMIMNLIKNAFKIKEFILNFGRYFKAEFPIIIDVNKNIAHDMGALYNYSVDIINYLLKDYKTKLNKQQIKQLLTIVDETFLIHQQLYVLFYNRYYAYDIEAPKVNWLKIEPEEYQQLKNMVIQKKKKKKLDSSKASIDNLDLSQFQKTYFSQTASTAKEFEFETLEV